MFFLSPTSINAPQCIQYSLGHTYHTLANFAYLNNKNEKNSKNCKNLGKSNLKDNGLEGMTDTGSKKSHISWVIIFLAQTEPQSIRHIVWEKQIPIKE